MVEREKVVRQMWDLYCHSSTIRLPWFWQEAFEAAYEDLTSEVPALRDAAVSEIAKMSIRSIDAEPVQSTVSYTHSVPHQVIICIFHFKFNASVNFGKSAMLMMLNRLWVFARFGHFHV